MHTFAVSPVERCKEALRTVPFSRLLRIAKEFGVEAGAANVPDLVATRANPFVRAVGLAFAEHYPLVLSPDDVWIAVAQGFATHVQQNAEALRGRFVRHEGKQILRVERNDFVKGSPDNDWPGCFAEFSDKIAQHIGKQRDLVVAKFSTTGAIEKVVSEIVLVAAMKEYFDYRVRTRCGIPEITLLGTVEDWVSIRRRAEVFSEYGLEWWTAELLPVLDQLVEAASGRPEVPFWESFYKLWGGSGGPYVSGWINVFFPYVTNPGRGVRRNGYVTWQEGGREGPAPESLGRGFMRVPFIWEYLNEELPMEFLGGFMGVSQDPATLSLRPALGWAISDPAAQLVGLEAELARKDETIDDLSRELADLKGIGKA